MMMFLLVEVVVLDQRLKKLIKCSIYCCFVSFCFNPYVCLLAAMLSFLC